MRLYRVFPWDASAAADTFGGALFVPEGGSGRFDNPHAYRAFYASLSPEGAVGEAFAGFARWRPALFHRGEARYALATYEVPDALEVADLDRVPELSALGIDRVREIVTRERAVTQALAGRIFAEKRYAGLRWWSVYVPDWTNVALWNRKPLALAAEPEPLSIGHRAVADAAAALPRFILKR